MMPQCDGIELASWLGRYQPSTAAIMVTGTSESRMIENSLRAGACGFLDKPLNVEAVQQEVDHATTLNREKRRLARIAAKVEEVATVRRWVMGPELARRGLTTDVYCRPMFTAGGDFICRHRFAPHLHLFMKADLSGHDFKFPWWQTLEIAFRYTRTTNSTGLDPSVLGARVRQEQRRDRSAGSGSPGPQENPALHAPGSTSGTAHPLE
jgi:hypothetical protein